MIKYPATTRIWSLMMGECIKEDFRYPEIFYSIESHFTSEITGRKGPCGKTKLSDVQNMASSVMQIPRCPLVFLAFRGGFWLWKWSEWHLDDREISFRFLLFLHDEVWVPSGTDWTDCYTPEERHRPLSRRLLCYCTTACGISWAMEKEELGLGSTGMLQAGLWWTVKTRWERRWTQAGLKTETLVFI